MQKSKQVLYNLTLGLTNQLLTIVLGILVPRLTLTSYGSEVNGLINAITQIYTYIALLEAGIGTSTIQALYKTIGNNDRADTNAVLAATSRYYKKTGILYLFAIIAFAMIYPLAIDSNIPRHTIALIIIFNGIGSVINYFFQAKYLLLLQAEGKNYVQTIMNMIVNILKNAGKIILMSNGADVVLVQTIGMFVSLLQMIYIYIYIKKKYKWINLSVAPNNQAISQSKNVLVHQLSGLIFNNTDTIILSVACGLKTVSVYSLYSMLIGMIGTALSTVTSSFIFSLGQTYHCDRLRFRKMFECYEVYYLALVFSLYAVTNVFLLPFIQVYTEGVSDANYLDPLLPILFISTHLLSGARSASSQAINIAGHFKLTQNRAVIESAVNLVISLMAVKHFGIYGVLLGTIAALLYRTNDMILYANKHILNRSPWITYRRWLINLALFAGITIVAKYIFSFIALDSYLTIVFWAIVCCIVIIPIFFVTVSLFDREVYQFTKSLIIPYIKAVIRKMHF
ncbi:MAG: sugar isomerase [Oscillospiraceae bacterium]|nr:sugar isomerase [Oscillospiraceae bacterium]